ncbi:hypothetical protein [Streptacidiphilus sp. EB103A]|uniref:hypothetical protein n=1 Tax=Streptacidiphilus sp. EB103A TaxID=3156275 RepID=UPI003516755A
MLQFQLDGTTHEYDDKRLMFNEAMEIQKACGLNAKDFNNELVAGDSLAYAAVFWLATLRSIVAAQGCTLKDAVAQLPFETWNPDLGEALATMKRVEPADPTEPAPAPAAGPDGSTAPTSPATSEPQPQASPTPTPGTATSDSSPTSSASAPGSGTT